MNSLKIIYSQHLELRLQIRKIPKNYPKFIYKKPEKEFFDNTTNVFVRVKKLWYNKKERYLMIAYLYLKQNDIVKIITCHPISEEKIINRVISKRWQEI